MEETKTKVEEVKEEAKDLVDHTTDFLETYYQLITINIAQKGINIASAVINAVVLTIIGLFAFGLISLGIGWWLGNLVDSRAGGFFMVAGIYIVIMAVIIVMRKKTILPLLRDFLTKKIYE
jgi:hypothetical protein